MASTGAGSGASPASVPNPFELVVETREPGLFRVLSLRGHEALNSLYVFELRAVVAPDVDLQAKELFGLRATITLHDAMGAARVIHGIVVAFRRIAGQVHPDGRYVELRVAPRLWLLQRRVTSRIFQHDTVPQVVAKILQWSEIPFVFRLQQSYSARPYCVQYQESDYDFIRRLLSEEGIFWYFAHSVHEELEGSGHDPVIFLDQAQGYPALGTDRLPLDGRTQPATLKYRERDQAHLHDDVDTMSRFVLENEVRSNAVLLRDYDFRHPLLELSSQRRTTDTNSVENQPLGRLQVYEHRGDYADPEITGRRANHLLDELRADSAVIEGESNARSLTPGYRWQLEAELTPQLQGEFVVRELWHEGQVPEETTARTPVYLNRFSAAPAELALRPERLPRRLIQSLESATVVGAPGEDIYTDEHGRVRVQFHWDLEGRRNEASTTWLRVSQGFAGASWGMQYIPRVGTEVLVSFLSGDPDRPIVVGALYNGTHPHPFPLPEQKTRSGVRTQSTPGGLGFNELSFDDQAGSEQVFLHAQRDFVTEVRRDASATVLRNQKVEVFGAQTNLVGQHQTERILGAAERTVEQDETVQVKGSRFRTAAGNDVLEVQRDRRMQVLGALHEEVRGESTVHTGADLTTNTQGSHTTLVGRHDARRSYTLHVEGDTGVSSTEQVEIASDKGIRLRCGQSILELSPQGIELVAPKLTLRSPHARVVVEEEHVRVYASETIVGKAKQVLWKGEASVLCLRSTARLDGTKVLLKTPENMGDPDKDPTKEVTVIELADSQGAALPYQRYVLELEDGTERSGFLGRDGRAELELETAATVRFPQLLESTKV